MKHLLLTLTLIFSTFSFAQEVKEDVIIQYSKGKKYIVHTAASGNTLWGIHTLYNVPVEAIVAANPGIENGIKEGYQYLIPIGNAESGTKDATQVRLHEIVKGETGYSLTKKYNVSLEELMALNPEMSAGLKIGQQVKIPVKNNVVEEVAPVVNPTDKTQTKVNFSDSIVQYTVQPNETLYTIAKRYMLPAADLQSFNKLKSTKIKEGDVLQIPLKKEQVKKVEIREVKPIKEVRKVDETLLFKKKEEYSIVVLLSFGLNDKNNASLQDLATEFYMGIELAADSLERLGLKAKINVIDCPQDSVGIMKILAKPEVKGADLIFGPLLPQSADIVGRWAGKNKIRMVCPSACNSALLKDNPFVYAAVTSDITQQRILAKYTLQNLSKTQLVLVNSGVARDKDIYDAFRTRFLELSKAAIGVKLIEIKSEDLAAYIRKNDNTTFIVPTRDRSATTKFMTLLQKSASKAGNGTVTVLGTKEWANFESVSGYMKTKFNITWASSSDLNYTLESTQQLLKLFRSKYKTDMGRVSAHGFDVMYYFAATLLMNQKVDQEVMNDFEMELVGQGSGFENNSCFILRHQDYELIRVASLHE